MQADEVTAWLYKYEWFPHLPVVWKQITHRLVKELTAETFVGLATLHQALSTQNSALLWETLDDAPISDRCNDMVDQLIRLTPRTKHLTTERVSYE